MSIEEPGVPFDSVLLDGESRERRQSCERVTGKAKYLVTRRRRMLPDEDMAASRNHTVYGNVIIISRHCQPRRTRGSEGPMRERQREKVIIQKRSLLYKAREENVVMYKLG